MTVNELADRLEEEELFPDAEDYYWPKLSPEEMALIIASLRAKAKAETRSR